jgi:membrane dipeptidase
MFIDNVEYMVEVAGIQGVGIGFDFFKFIWDQWSAAKQDDLVKYLMPVEFVPDLQHHGHARNLTRRLIERGWKDGDIEKLLYGNWMRVFQARLGD